MRFPGFNDNWEEYLLGNISKIQRGASPRPISDKKWYDYKNQNVGWVRISDVTKSSKFLTKTEDYFSDEGIKKSRFLPKGSLIMSICATIGKPIITDIDTCIHDGFVGFSNLTNVNEEFLYYLLNILENKFCSLGQTGSQANLNSELIRKTKVLIPSMDEQKKIINFLSLVDKKIELLEKTSVLSKKDIISVRKGLMDSLLKNSKFNSKIISLNEICLIKKGKQLNKEDMVKNGKYYVLNGGKTPSGFTNTWNVEKNTITISEGGSCGFVHFNKEKFYCGGHCYSIKVNSKEIDNSFLYHYLKNNEKYIMKLGVGSGLKNIQKKDMDKIKVILPPLTSQILIKNLLNLKEKKIELLENKKEILISFKKYLLQKMFV